METITPDEKIIDAFVTVLSALPPEAQKEIISRLEWSLHGNSDTVFEDRADMSSVNPAEALDPS